jgi:DNA-binding NarL/FixJ family response regulator
MTRRLGNPIDSPCIVIGDDHPLVQSALRGALQHAFPRALIFDAKAVEGVVEELTEAPREVDLVLLDLDMPGNAGFTGLLLLLSSFPGVPVAILSAQETPATIRKAIRLGASGYIPKTASLTMMVEAVEKILDGDVWVPQSVSLTEQPDGDTDIEAATRLSALSPQQLRILARLVEGKLNKQIAHELGIAEQTVKVHVSTILKKLRVSTRTQLAVLVERCAKSGA